MSFLRVWATSVRNVEIDKSIDEPGGMRSSVFTRGVRSMTNPDDCMIITSPWLLVKLFIVLLSKRADSGSVSL